jgi:hypothetical protein
MQQLVRVSRAAAWCAALACAALFGGDAAAQARESPQQTFERAMRERDRGDLHEAIRSFNAILDEHPGLNRARLELAVAYYHALDHRAALEQARRVLADPSTPPEVRANVERLVAQIEAEAAPHRFGASLSAGLLYDSNVSAGPASPSYVAGGNIISLDPNAVGRSDQGLLVTLGGTHQYLSGFRPGLGGREGALLWLSQAMFSALEYRRENAYDLHVLSLTTGPAWISPPRLRFLAPLQFDRLQLGGEHYLDVYGVSPSLVIGNVAGGELTLDAQFQKRGYQRPIDAGRDSGYYSAGLQAGRVVAGMTLQAGARVSREDADAAQWDYRGREVFGLLAVNPAERVSAYARLTYAHSDYDAPDPTAGSERTDRETRFALGASYQFGEGSPRPWSASATWLEIRHRSDIAFYAFERRQVSLTVTRGF